MQKQLDRFVLFPQNSFNCCKAIIFIIALNCPVDSYYQLHSNGESTAYSWTIEALESINLSLQTHISIETIMPLVPTTHTISEYEKCRNCRPYLEVIPSSLISYQKILIFITLQLIFSSHYDGRGRSLLRNLYGIFKIPEAYRVQIEYQIRTFLVDFPINLQTYQYKKKKSRMKSAIKFAKIGVVGLSVGAILAVTGGLAAPAMAGALVAMGGGLSMLISAVSVTSMAILFGCTGTGLAGEMKVQN